MLVGQQNSPSCTKEKLDDSSAKSDNCSCGTSDEKDHSLPEGPPTGWIRDNESREGSLATFYRKEYSYPEAKAHHSVVYIMYIAQLEGYRNAEELMKFNVTNAKRESAKYVIRHGKPILIYPYGDRAMKERAQVLTFFNDAENTYWASAYIEGGNATILISIHSATADLIHKDYPDFIKLVKSYYIFGRN
jgi:hypothetical protein